MSDKGLVARASTTINAPLDRVWDALVTPKIIKQYMFGTNVTSDWKEGGPILFKGEWEGRSYEDKGVILKMNPKKMLRYSHYSPLSGLPDKAENYHTVTIDVVPKGEQTTFVALTQDNNATEEEKQHSEKNWGMMLAGLKKLLETQSIS